MGPITLGILFAVGLKILKTADVTRDGQLSVPGVIVSLVVCALMLRTRISPLWFMAIAGLLGALGIINR
jgi:chromate transporter